MDLATEKELVELRDEWSVICENKGDEGAVFAQDVNNKVERLIRDIKQKEFLAYTLKNDNGEFIALLDVIHALPNTDIGWLKIFDMTITPKCTLSGGNETEIKRVLRNVFVEALKLLLDKNSDVNEIKIYARNDITKELFSDIASDVNLKETLSKINVVILFQAKWLVLRKKSNPGERRRDD
ncbi:hypothetical protein [uncultured Campylobacter sp.]|uniref:hypothetical protein n=1 Tax=uncultured Campylobacter sp. TaxID=218934 RepID=UPI002617DB4A|nr:hypothetical protein [uncultured Campylobacter sp.]